MSTFHYPITLYGLTTGRAVEVKALVDTGATFSRLPARMLDELGYRSSSREAFELGDGRVVEEDVGDAMVGVDGKRGMTRVVFGRPGEEPLLGAVTLAQFLLAPDPVHRRLLPVRGLLV